MSVTTAGVYQLDEADYHADPVAEGSLSVTGAKVLLDCPERFRYRQLHPVTSAHFDFGHAAHAKVLGKGLAVAEIPDGILASNGAASTKPAKEFIEQARADGLVPLKSDDVRVIDAMAAKLAEHPVARSLFREGRAEESLFWRCADTQVMLRARLDWLTRLPSGRPVVVDYKTTVRTASPSDFYWESRKYRYPMQDRWYVEGATTLADDLGLDLGEHDEPAFLFVVQEKEAPYLVTVCEVDADDREYATDLNKRARALYLDCRTKDEWPGYEPTIHRLARPAA